ncbi:MAG TPA: hypothetical protein PKO36_14565 [Candidatus Hydrogenedentes bacterium]|nr:hypothetical protein [Candidatus Hydrogenedentota bacterium]HOT49482.1 hypothetical protein [Candidatus Hydrogenedentota bacterium]HOV75991.1 hypothetical protein [Candidatus Hydrogenedentota bacterium]HPC18132.1 hypothetical protein [Candidatus Hydrogenedentota bacterium]HRT21718.1 hypothetical protein [Candidatus Hydrogenedentota bacterium]
MSVTVGMLFVAGLSLFVSGSASPPPVPEIIGHVIKATIPDRPYSVTIEQTMTRQGKPPVKTRFDAKWNAEKGLVIQPDSVKVIAPSETPEETGSDVQMGIDVAKYLRDMLKWPDVTVAEDSKDGKSCWRLSGTDPRGPACRLWVDADRWCVTHLALDIQGKRFAEAVFEYRRVNSIAPATDGQTEGYWLFSTVTVHHALDGTRIMQEFAEYVFEKP